MLPQERQNMQCGDTHISDATMCPTASLYNMNSTWLTALWRCPSLHITTSRPQGSCLHVNTLWPIHATCTHQPSHPACNTTCTPLQQQSPALHAGAGLQCVTHAYKHAGLQPLHAGRRTCERYINVTKSPCKYTPANIAKPGPMTGNSRAPCPQLCDQGRNHRSVHRASGTAPNPSELWHAFSHTCTDAHARPSKH